MAKSTDWTKVLNSIIHFHEKDSIVFQITDVEELHAYIRNLENTVNKMDNANTELAKKLSRSQDQLLVNAINSMDLVQKACEPVSKFKVYA